MQSQPTVAVSEGLLLDDASKLLRLSRHPISILVRVAVRRYRSTLQGHPEDVAGIRVACELVSRHWLCAKV